MQLLLCSMTTTFGEGQVSSNLIHCDRIRPSMCRICNQQHDHDNAYLTIWGAKQFISLYCYRANANTAEDSPKPKVYLGMLRPDARPTYTLSDFAEYNPQDQAHLPEPQLIYNTPLVTNDQRPLLEVNSGQRQVRIIKSYLGTGKSWAFIRWIEHYNDQVPRILFLSPRTIFAINLTGEMNLRSNLGFSSYTEHMNNNRIGEVNRLGIQMESLHRLENARPYDVLIIDEIESCLKQFSSESTMAPDLSGMSEFLNSLSPKLQSFWLLMLSSLLKALLY